METFPTIPPGTRRAWTGKAGLSGTIVRFGIEISTTSFLLVKPISGPACSIIRFVRCPQEDVQHLAGDSDPRTTRLHDRRRRRVTRNLVERISI
jgi:hypothetical protein